MEPDLYKTISENSTGIFKDKQSKFISFAFYVQTEEEVKEILKELKKKHFDANHHVYAFIIGTEKKILKCSDDGEPSNSSGTPVLNTLKSFELTNTLIVVVRYFGGTKLGIPGLINAYKSAAIDALNNSKIIEKTINTNFKIICSYTQLNHTNYIIKKHNIEILKQTFEQNCEIYISVRKSKSNEIVEILKPLVQKVEFVY